MASPLVERSSETVLLRPPPPKKVVTFEASLKKTGTHRRHPKDKAQSGDEETCNKNSQRLLRKRSLSFSEGQSKFHSFHNSTTTTTITSKRLKRISNKKLGFSSSSEEALQSNVLPSKFLLGGNIRDPLNLNSLSDERISRIVNAFTPVSSPLPTPKHRKAEYKIQVFIPPNISDPLNLNEGVDEKVYESQLLLSPGVPKRKKFRVRKRFKKPAVSEESEDEEVKVPMETKTPNLQTLPVSETPNYASKATVSNASKREKFQFGNYNRYYGYRNPMDEDDIRLRFMRSEWFRNKDVLDIGCNVGRLTLNVARIFAPKSILGLDIDSDLIAIAQKNARINMNDKNEFPKSMPHLFGSLNPKFIPQLKFIAGNYVLESDELLDFVLPEFDTIMCLSTSKWIHLHYGDEGIKRVFKRVYASLRPGGTFILEAQGFSSYKRKKKLTGKMFEIFSQIQLRPEGFSDYLIHEVGFSSFEVIAVPQHVSKGFQRPLTVFTKTSPESFRNTSPYEEPSPKPEENSFSSKEKDEDVIENKKDDVKQLQNKSSPYYSLGSGPTPPGRTPSIGMTPQYDLGTPAYNPEECEFQPGTSYGYNTPCQSGITPGYSGPSPESFSKNSLPHGGSPLYSGPPPGTFSTASTPGNEEAGYTPKYTPSYYVGSNSPAYSPGNATPNYYYSPAGNISRSTRNVTSPQLQMSDITGNSTPHPGASLSPSHEPRYLWYGSDGNNPGNEEPSSSPKGPYTYSQGLNSPSQGELSNPTTPGSPSTNSKSPSTNSKSPSTNSKSPSQQ